MSEYRAIMTTRDRERISGDVDVEDTKRYQSVHRVRRRIEELERDAALLAEHHPDLFADLQTAVCEQDSDGLEPKAGGE